MCYRTQPSTTKPGHMSREDQDAKHVVEEEEDESPYHGGAYATRMHKDALYLYDKCKTPKERRDLIMGYYSVEVGSRTEACKRDEIRTHRIRQINRFCSCSTAELKLFQKMILLYSLSLVMTVQSHL